MTSDTISPPATPAFEPVMTTSHYAKALIHFSRQMPPEQAADRARQEAQRLLRPDVYGVIACTLLFGVLGIFSVSRRSAMSNAVGLPTGRYWMAFVATILVQIGLLLAVNTYANGSR